MDAITPDLVQLVLIPLVLVGVRWLVRDTVRWYRARPEAEQELIQSAVRSAVYAAEQLGNTRLIGEKRQFALEMANRLLQRYGVKLHVADLAGLIEATVWDEINRYR